MPAAFLFVDNRGSAGACRVYRYDGATPSQVGTSFGAKFSDAATNPCLRHCAKWFQGNLYAFAQNGIYKKDDPTTDDITDTWTIALTFTAPETAQARTSGLHVVHINDSPWLVCVKARTADTSWGWAKFDGTTWTQDAAGTTGPDFDSIHDVCVYRNVLYMIGNNVAVPDAMSYDPATNTFVNLVEPFASSRGNVEMCVYNDRLLCVYLTASPAVVHLAEFTGGAWVDIPGSAGHTAPTAGYASAASALFTDGTDLYAMVPATDDGWRCLKWDSDLGTPTNISATVLPASLLGAADGGQYGQGAPTYPIEDGRFIACVDQETDPTTADIQLFQSIDCKTAGTPWTLWKWNGPSTLITVVDVGGNVFHAIPSGLTAGGEHIWSVGKLDIWITGTEAGLGKERIKFRAKGAAGVADKKVSFKYDAENEPPLAVATLSAVGVVSGSPAGSPSLGTNQMLSVDADPTVEYYADWNVTADGFITKPRAQLKPIIEA